MIEQWELVHFPFERDALRFKARVRGTEEDVKQLIARLPVEAGNPFVTLSQDYDWAFYLYKLDQVKLLKAMDVFNSFSPNGRVVESAALRVDKELPPMLEDVLEFAAKHLSKTASAKLQEAREPESPEPPQEVRKKASEAAAAPQEEKASQGGVLSNHLLNPSYTFASFIVGPNNRFTHAAAQAVGENPGKIYNPLFVYGGVGLGKTHLMQAIGHMIISRNPNMKIVFISTEKFMSLVVESIRSGNVNQLRDQFRNVDALLIDDVQFLSGSESTQEEFFHVFNNLHHLGKQIVVTCDRPPKQLSTLEDRLRSRFEWGLITDLKSPNLETRIAILKSKSEQINLSLTGEQIHYVAERSKSNIRQLEGVVKKIFATTSLMHAKVDIPMLEALLAEDSGEPLPSAAAAKSPPSSPPVADKPKDENKAPAKADEKSGTELEGIIRRLNQAASSETAAPAPPLGKAAPPPASPPPSPARVEIPSGITPLRPDEPPPKSVPPPAAHAVPEKAAPVPSLGKAAPPPAAGRTFPPGERPDPDEPDTDMTLRPVELICFYPKGKKTDYQILRGKFNLILKKHKLKFRLARIAEKPFDYEGKPDYGFFSRVCRSANCSIALVLGPPPTPMLSEDDFAGMLSAVLEEERISLQFIPWSEMSKDYRFLNCALDLSLLAPMGGADAGTAPKA